MNSLKTILMSSVAAITFAAVPALAQQATVPPTAAHTQTEAQMTPDATLAPRSYDDSYGERFAEWGDANVETLLGSTVVNDAGETIGDVDNFALVQDQIVAVVGIGGFLGLGEHQVGVPLDQLEFVGDQLLLPGVTREQLEAMPAYDEAGGTVLAADQTLRTGFEDVMPGAMGEAEVEADIAADTTPPVMADEPVNEVAEAAGEAGQAIEGAAETAADEIAETAGEAGDAMEGAADEATQEIAETTDAPATGDAMAPVEGEGVAQAPAVPPAAEPTPGAPAATDMAADDAGGWTDDMDTIFADIADRQIAELIGMPVASADGEVVGEIDNFVLEGESVAAIVGVGGFLGLGEHDVALSLDQMTFDGEKLVLSSITEDQLREMPAYDEVEPSYLPQDGTLRSTYDR